MRLYQSKNFPHFKKVDYWNNKTTHSQIGDHTCSYLPDKGIIINI